MVEVALQPPAEGSLPPAWLTALMTLVAGAVLLANCLLTCPSRFSERHQADTSALRPVVEFLSLGGQWPTMRGVEVRNLVYYAGAAALTGLAGIGLILARRRSRLTLDDLFDARARARGPVFWWIILLITSAVSSFYSHASEVCQGQTMVRLLHFAWWWPLAGLLSVRDARRLCWALMAALAATAALGLWYHVARVLPDQPEARLQYPMGNELWLAACLLPAILIAAGPLTQFILHSARPQNYSRVGVPSYLRVALLMLVVLLVGAAIALTRSRSALAGLAVGAIVFIGFAVSIRARRVVTLCGIILAIAAVGWIQFLRSHGEMGQRAHSIRTRLNHEWPYAVNLFLQKPVAGHGDGAYAMLAGQYARMDQLDDPSTMRFDEWSWTAHAHNEFLELLADLGLVGAVAVLAAILLTLYHALRFCDVRREDSERAADRWLVIGLAAALAALAAEQCSDSALREPGLPAVFFSVWAILWAMIRDSRTRPATSAEGSRLAPSTLRLAGVAVVGLSVLLAYKSAEDWRGVRARFDAEKALERQDYAAAIDRADLSARLTLDPFQRNLARLMAIWARALAFDAALQAKPGPLTPGDLELSQQALAQLARLNADAPRFLRVSRMAGELYLNRSRAFERSGEAAARQEAEKKFVDALTASRADEPFMLERVVALWRARQDARSVDRIYWLRCLLRAGEMDEQVAILFETLPRYSDFRTAMEATFAFAQEEAAQPPGQWKDRLVPESFRLAALAKLLGGSPADAEKLAARAEELYAAAGPALFAAHAASIHEMVRYSMAADITAETDKNLARLARAQTLLAPPTDAATPLRGNLGRTRLALLLAAGRAADAERQADLLRKTEGGTLERITAEGWLLAASLCMTNPAQATRSVGFAEQAAALQPERPDAQAALLSACLRTGRDTLALPAARRFIQLSQDPKRAMEYLKRLRAGTPSAGIWGELEREHPELKPATTNPARGVPATAPSIGPP